MKLSYALAAAGSVVALAASTAPALAATGDHSTYTRHSTTSDFGARSTTALPSTTTTTATVPVTRIAGSDRIVTAIAASYSRWDDAGTTGAAKAVVLSRSDDYADALGGAALAGAAGGPLLLTPTSGLRSDVQDEIDRLLARKGTVYILGGATSVSKAVSDRLASLGYTVKRLAGIDRYATSVIVSKQVGQLQTNGLPQFVFATTGRNFPDGLAAGATAGGYGASVVLTNDSTLPDSVKTYLGQLKTDKVPTFAVGGQAAAAPWSWLATYAGSDRFQTAQWIAEDFWGDKLSTTDDPAVVGLATGMNWPDALSGGSFVAGGGPLVLTKPDLMPTPTSTAITTLVKSATPTTIQLGAVFGGTGSVSSTVYTKFGTLLNQ